MRIEFLGLSRAPAASAPSWVRPTSPRFLNIWQNLMSGLRGWPSRKLMVARGRVSSKNWRSIQSRKHIFDGKLWTPFDRPWSPLVRILASTKILVSCRLSWITIPAISGGWSSEGWRSDHCSSSQSYCSPSNPRRPRVMLRAHKKLMTNWTLVSLFGVLIFFFFYY